MVSSYVGWDLCKRKNPWKYMRLRLTENCMIHISKVCCVFKWEVLKQKIQVREERFYRITFEHCLCTIINQMKCDQMWSQNFKYNLKGNVRTVCGMLLLCSRQYFRGDRFASLFALYSVRVENKIHTNSGFYTPTKRSH